MVGRDMMKKLTTAAYLPMYLARLSQFVPPHACDRYEKQARAAFLQ